MPDKTGPAPDVTREDALGGLLLYLSNLPLGGSGISLNPFEAEKLIRLGFAIGTREDYVSLVAKAALTAFLEAKAEIEKARTFQAERMADMVGKNVIGGGFARPGGRGLW